MIVGIDPGTTVGWAIIDFDGKFIATGSKRNFDLDSIVATLVPYGKILVVGTDKAKTPSLVQEVATKVGAKSISPSQDLRVVEKRAMTSHYKFENHHEMDALACAFFAFKQVQPLVYKVRTSLSRKNQSALFPKVFELVLKENINIQTALSRLLSPDL